MVLIGISGLIGSGKSTAAEILEHYGYVRYSIATPLKQIAEVFGFNPRHIYGTQEEKEIIDGYWGISPRQFLQRFGTEIGREQLGAVTGMCQFNIWVKMLEKFILEHPNTNIVVDDVRFEDEAELIRKLGGIIVLIVRPGVVKDTHRSELGIEMNNVLVIRNDGDRLQFRDNVVSKLFG